MPDYQIQGGLPWAGAAGGAGMFAGLGGDPKAALGSLGSSYSSAYTSALAMNSQNYSNVLQGYQQTLANQTGAEDAIGRGYTDLSNQVLGGLQGANQANQQLINNAYTRQSGTALQGLINSGLGNSTVLSSVQRGIGLDNQLALTNSNNQFAGTIAGYQSQLGQAGLGYQNQAVMQNTGEANKQLDWMNSVSAAYPNAQAYGQLAQQYGMFDQMNQDRALAQQLRGSSGPGTAGGYVPSGTGFPPSAVNWGGSGVQDPGGYGVPPAPAALPPHSNLTGFSPSYGVGAGFQGTTPGDLGYGTVWNGQYDPLNAGSYMPPTNPGDLYMGGGGSPGGGAYGTVVNGQYDPLNADPYAAATNPGDLYAAGAPSYTPGYTPGYGGGSYDPAAYGGGYGGGMADYSYEGE